MLVRMGFSSVMACELVHHTMSVAAVYKTLELRCELPNMRAWSFSLILSISLASAAALPDPEQGFSDSSILKIRSNLLEIASARYNLVDLITKSLTLS